jgi:hypothetical protein
VGVGEFSFEQGIDQLAIRVQARAVTGQPPLSAIHFFSQHGSELQSLVVVL